MKTKLIKQGDRTTRHNKKLAARAGFISLVTLMRGSKTACAMEEFIRRSGAGGRP